MTTQFCPICGAKAIYNAGCCLVCGSCYEALRGRELSLDTIPQLRKQLGVRLSTDENGISECYKTDTEEDGNIAMILLWIMMPGGSKRYINQKVISSIGRERPRKALEIPELILRKGRGRPRIEINIPVVSDLVYNRGISRRKLSRFLGVNYSTLSRKLKESVT